MDNTPIPQTIPQHRENAHSPQKITIAHGQYSYHMANIHITQTIPTTHRQFPYNMDNNHSMWTIPILNRSYSQHMDNNHMTQIISIAHELYICRENGAINTSHTLPGSIYIIDHQHGQVASFHMEYVCAQMEFIISTHSQILLL